MLCLQTRDMDPLILLAYNLQASSYVWDGQLDVDYYHKREKTNEC